MYQQHDTTSTGYTTEQPHILKQQYKRRTLVAFVLFLILTVALLITLNILPVSRVPSEYYSLEQHHGIAQGTARTVTRGALEAQKSHKPHDAVNADYETVPNKYISSQTGLPLGNYVVMIDAGSSGSRVYVYQYKLPFTLTANNTVKPGPDPSADLLHVTVAEDVNHSPIVRKQEPGLSSFSSNPHDAFTSIEPLLQFASDNIPPQLHSRTPIYIMATAGLRLLDETDRNAILDNVRNGLRRWSEQGKFSFTHDDQADMITGEQEGLYGWVALNYVYNRFGDLKRTYPTGGLDPHTYATLPRLTSDAYRQRFDEFQIRDKRTGKVIGKQSVIVDDAGHKQATSGANTTVALLEIGGGSAQVAFAIQDSQSAHPPNYVHKLDLNLLHCDYEQQNITSDEHGNTNPKMDGSTDNNIQYRTDESGQQWPVGGHIYHVYTASFLGHGANAARMRYVNYLLDRELFLNNDDHHSIEHISLVLDPCGIYGQAEVVTRKNGWGYPYNLLESDISASSSSSLPPLYDDTSHFMGIDTSFLEDYQVLVIGTGQWSQCLDHLKQLLPPQPPVLHNKRRDLSSPQKSVIIEAAPYDRSFYPYNLTVTTKDNLTTTIPSRCEYNCPINDQYQPILSPSSEHQEQQHFFGFSEYWFLTRDVLRIDPTEFSGDLFDTLSQELCDIQISKQSWPQVKAKLDTQTHFPSSANDQRVRQQCFKGAWMATMLHHGHGLPKTKSPGVITPVSSIEGSEVQWSLGAVLVKVTKQLQQNSRQCAILAREGSLFGLSQHVVDAKMQFAQDEEARLQYADYWGKDAGWSKVVYVYLLLGIIAAFVAIVLVLVLFQHYKTKDDKVVVYTRL